MFSDSYKDAQILGDIMSRRIEEINFQITLIEYDDDLSATIARREAKISILEAERNRIVKMLEKVNQFIDEKDAILDELGL